RARGPGDAVPSLRVLREPHVPDEYVDLAHFETEHLIDGVRHLSLHLRRHRRDVGGVVNDHEQLQVQGLVAKVDPDTLVRAAGRQHAVAVSRLGRIHTDDALYLAG